MKSPLRILLPIILFFSLDVFAQKEWSNWYLNGYNLITFKNGGIQSVTNFSPPSGGANFSDLTFASSQNHGVAYADPATGEMKFIVSGVMAYDRNYKIILTKEFLRACPGDRLAFHIIPFQNDPNKFYVVQFQDMQHPVTAAATGLQVRCPNSVGLAYSVFDLTLNGGLGDFVSMNNQLQGGTAVGVRLLRHANGKDVWVLTHDYGNNQFKAYLFTDAGISAPVTSAIGPTIIANSKAWIDGEFNVSHDGKTVFLSRSESGEFYMMNFDNATGTLSNSRRYSTPHYMAMPIFSPDDSKLYFYGTYRDAAIFQMDFNAPDLVASITRIASDRLTGYFELGLGMDGKIYISRFSGLDVASGDYVDYLSVINCPNLPKYACNFEEKGLRIGSGGYMQPFINDVVKDPKAPPVGEFSLGRDTAICFGSYKLSAPPGWQQYKWNTGETTREINVTKAGTYYVLAGSTGFSCPSAYGYIKIDDAASKLDLGKDTVLCPKQDFKLKVPSTYSGIQWNDGGTSAEKTITTNGVYSVTALDANGCVTRDTVNISFNSLVSADFGRDNVLCAGQNLLLQLQPPDVWFYDAKYAWSNGSTKDTLRVRTPGTYWGEVVYKGCTLRDTIVVSYVDAAAFSLGADTTICTGETLELRTNISNAVHEWSTGETTGTIRIAAAGTYWVKVNNGSCTVTDTIKVKLQNKPGFDLGADKDLCQGETALLELNIPGATFKWQDTSSKSSFMVRSAGKVKVAVNFNGCISTDSINVSYRSLPVSKLASDTSLCEQQSIRLDVTDPSVQRYEWQDGTSSPQLTVRNAGIYSVALTGTNGCINRDTIRVSSSALPQFSLGKDTALCDKQVLRLRAGLSNARYKWNDGSTGTELNASRTGTYWLEVEQNGCVKRDSINVNFKPIPTVDLGKDTILCEGQVKRLNALYDGARYTWQDQYSGAAYEVNKPGSYHVTVDLNGCYARDTVMISYKSKPKFSLGADTSICTGEELLLRPGLTNASYRWQDGSGTPSYTVRNEGVYTLSATNECGSSTDEIIITKGVCKLYMPNAFTPNGDGLNDIFRVKDPGFIATIDLRVYNIFGELIFRTTDPRKGWDGSYKGKQQPNGNYAWQISISTRDGVKDYRKGTVALIR